MKRDAIDFHEIPDRQVAIHTRLENWGRSCWSTTGPSASPMFLLYRSDEVWHAPEAKIPVDQHDADKIARGVRALPQPHMQALQWYYVRPGSPIKARRIIGCTLEALRVYVLDGRSMLINRRV